MQTGGGGDRHLVLAVSRWQRGRHSSGWWRAGQRRTWGGGCDLPLSPNLIHCASGWALLGHSSGRSLAFSGGGCGNASQPESGGRGIPSNIVMYKDANGGAGTANSAVNGCGRAAAQVRMFDAGLSIFFVREQHRERGVPERLRHSKIRHWRASPSDCC